MKILLQSNSIISAAWKRLSTSGAITDRDHAIPRRQRSQIHLFIPRNQQAFLKEVDFDVGRDRDPRSLPILPDFL